MPRHTCHAVRCDTVVPPRLLMCRRHWDRVPVPLQAEVYRTVALRGRGVDATWAPWWRAAHRAIAHVARLEGLDAGALLARALAFADKLEGNSPEAKSDG